MQENWQYWLTTMIALIALFNSHRAKAEAKKANDIQKKKPSKK